MATKDDYIPSNKLEFQEWFNNFLAKAEANVDKFNINQDLVNVLKPLNETYNTDIVTENDLLTKKLKQFKITADDKAGAVTVIRKASQGIKSSLKYTEAVGRDFRILTPDVPFDPKTYMPTIAVRRVTEGVEISFEKSETEGAHIYRCKQGDADFVFMAYDVHSPYIDTKNMDQHVVYQYYVKGVIDGKEIGKKSHVAMITI